MRRLVINADDFGLTSGINRAVLEAHKRGVVSSATLMANGPRLEQAIQFAQLMPGLSVGCHVVLVDGAPLLGPKSIPSLIGEDGKEFRSSLASFARAAIAGRLNGDEIEAETTAQIRRLQAAGIAVSHVDTHKHAHLFPQVFRPLVRAAKTCGVRSIRNPFEPAKAARLSREPSLWKRWITARLLQGYARAFLRTIEAEGLAAPDGCLGIVATGALDESQLAWLLARIPQGTWELVCHPGYVDAELQGVRTRLRESRASELRLLTSPAMRDLLSRENIEVLSYEALAI